VAQNTCVQVMIARKLVSSSNLHAGLRASGCVRTAQNRAVATNQPVRNTHFPSNALTETTDAICKGPVIPWGWSTQDSWALTLLILPLAQVLAMLTLEERIARLEKQTHVVEVHADSNSAALADIPDEVRVWRCLRCYDGLQCSFRTGRTFAAQHAQGLPVLAGHVHRQPQAIAGGANAQHVCPQHSL